jgi:hypothetical protein
MKRPRDPGVLLLQKASTRSGRPVHGRRQGGRQIEDDRGVFSETGGAWFRFRAGIPPASLIVRPSLVRRSFVVRSSSFVRRRRSFVVVVVRRRRSFVVVRSSHVVRSLP